MGMLRIIKDALTNQFYQGVGAHVVPRGISIPLDIFGDGEVRYGQKVEFVLPLLAPDNRFKLEDTAIYLMDRVQVDRESKWLEIGGYVSIGREELHEVADVVEDFIIFADRLRADHPIDQPVYHYSNPIKVEGNYSAGATTLVVDSTAFILRGDHIAISSRPDVTLAFKEYRVIDYRLTSVVDGIYQYQVSLDRGIHRSLQDEEIIQIRAFLAYKSNIIDLPVNEGFVYPIEGPFLLDWVSAPFMYRREMEETQTIRRYDGSHVEINPVFEIEKNHLVLDRPIRSEQFLFWEKVIGGMDYDRETDRFVAFPTGARATGYIEVDNAPEVENNDWFTLDDGYGVRVTFEYMADSATFVPTPGRTVIDIEGVVFDSEVAAPTEDAINAVPGFKIKASRGHPARRINLIHDETSEQGNQRIEIASHLQRLGWVLPNQIGTVPNARYALSGGASGGEFRMQYTAVPPMEVPFTYATGGITTGEPSTFFNNDLFRIDDSLNATIFEYQVDGAYVPTPSSAATGFIEVDSPSLVQNNDWFSLDDGYGTKIYFEYMADAATFESTYGYVTIDVTGAIFDTDLAVPTEDAINKVEALKITADRSTPANKINLTNEEISILGNQPIELSPNLQIIGWTASNAAGAVPTQTYAMAGGTDAVETIDLRGKTTASEVAILTAAAVNRADLQIEAEYPGTFNSFRMTSLVRGAIGNIPITTNITDPSFVAVGMTGGAGGMVWNFEIYADRETLVRVRFYPNDWISDTVIPAETLTQVAVSLLPTDQTVERIDILYKVDGSDAEIQMGDWNPSTPPISAISYEYVTQMYGDYDYGSTGLSIKPLWPTLKNLQLRLGVTDQLNTGLIHV